MIVSTFENSRLMPVSDNSVVGLFLMFALAIVNVHGVTSKPTTNIN